MKTSTEFLVTFAERLGWALLHSLWQGALAAALLAVALCLLRKRSAALRHAVCLLTLLALVAVVAGPMLFMWSSNSFSGQSISSTAISEATKSELVQFSPSIANIPMASPEDASLSVPAKSVIAAPLPSVAWRARLDPMLPWLSAVWIFGVILLSLRHFFGWQRLRAMRLRGTHVEPDLQRSFARLLERFGRKTAVRLLESRDAAVPMLAGLLKPVVLLPARVVTGLGEREIEAILAHELAHLVRRDAWSNLAQVAIETLLFYHPAVWWIGRCARQERENAADDLALQICADRRVYAGALAHLAEMHAGQQAALAATGGSLLARIRRIVRPLPVESPAGGWSLGIPALLTALALVAVFRTQAQQVKPLDAVPNSGAENVAQETTAEAEARIEAAFQNALARSHHWAASGDALLPAQTVEKRKTGLTFGFEPVAGPDSHTIDLSLVPQVVEFEGFINYGSTITTASPAFNAEGFQIGSTQTVITPNVINQPIFNTRKVTTSISIFDGQTVLIGGLIREDAPWKIISVVAENQPDAKAAEDPPRKADDAKTWIADAFQLDDKAKREAAIECIRAAMTGGNVDDARAGVTAFVQLSAIEFDKASFRPAVRALLGSADAATRAAAASAFTMTGADAEDLPRIFALADDPAPEVRDGLTYVIVSLTRHDVRNKAASDAILKLMANLPRDSRSVAHAMWGVKLSPEIEAKVLEFCRDIDHASNGSVGYNFFYGSLSTQANKSEASCKRLIELLAHPDTTNIAGRSAWGLQQGVDRAQFGLVAEAMVKVIEARSGSYLRNNALRNLRAYGNAAHAPTLKALLAKPGATGDMRKDFEETLAALEARPVAGSAPRSQEVLDGVAAVVNENVITSAQVRDLVEPLEKAARDQYKGEELVEKIKQIRSKAINDLKAQIARNTTGASAGSGDASSAAPPAEKLEIEVEWKGKWWPATVLKKDGERTQIHYVGYGAEWDEWVTAERVRQPIAAAAQPLKTEEDKKKEEAAQRVEKNRAAARVRANEDKQRYTFEELGEIETLYQVANTKGKRSPEAKESLKKLLEKYDKANRTGCATLYLGQASEGAERLEYLTRAVEKFGDCYYFNGCQVGGYGRFVLALTLWDKGDKDKARALLAELKTTYKDATDHNGRPMGEVAEAVEKELAAKE